MNLLYSRHPLTTEYKSHQVRVAFTFNDNAVKDKVSILHSAKIWQKCSTHTQRDRSATLHPASTGAHECSDRQLIHLLQPVGTRAGGRNKNAIAAYCQQEDKRQSMIQQHGTCNVQPRAVRATAKEVL